VSPWRRGLVKQIDQQLGRARGLCLIPTVVLAHVLGGVLLPELRAHNRVLMGRRA
jgi:hypothetical protein